MALLLAFTIYVVSCRGSRVGHCLCGLLKRGNVVLGLFEVCVARVLALDILVGPLNGAGCMKSRLGSMRFVFLCCASGWMSSC
jgi:hypothetical protein